MPIATIVRGAEALDAADHGRAGEPLLAHALDDRLVERFAVPRVGLPDEESQQLALAFELHSALPATTPQLKLLSIVGAISLWRRFAASSIASRPRAPPEN
jgi:hypothetical protein